MLTEEKFIRISSICLNCVIGLALFSLHVLHISSVFENETDFSNPAKTKFNKELIFQSDHALYYSSFKTIAEAPDFSTGLQMLIYNNLTEYPNTVNMIQRFYIFPEIAIGFFYKQFVAISKYFNVETFTCWMVGSDEAQVNCDGPGMPITFYLVFVWYMGGLTVFILFIYGTYLSNIVGGLSAVAYFFSIHNDATMIHRYPAARENFAMPFILWHMAYLTMTIERFNIAQRSEQGKRYFRKHYHMISRLTILSLLANLSWHFSVYIFATQIMVVFILFQLNMIDFKFFKDYIVSHIISHTIAYCVSFQNAHYFLTFNNPFTSTIISILILARNFRKKEDENNATQEVPRSFAKALLGYCFSIETVVVTMLISIYLMTELGSHKFSISPMDSPLFMYKDIIMAKLRLQPPSFNTLYYLCKPEMSFIDFDTLKVYNKLFVGKFVGVFIVIWLYKWLQKRREIPEDNVDKIERSKNYLIEDFLEENRVSMKDLVNADTDKQIKKCLDQLKQCDYDYEKYKRQKRKSQKPKVDEMAAFLNDVKKFKDEISEKEKPVHSRQNSGAKEEPQPAATSDKPEDCDTEHTPNNEEPTSDIPKEDEEEDVTTTTKDDPEITYLAHFVQPHYLFNILQTMIFIVMTALVLKMKYLLTPFMCIVASSIPPKNWFPKSHHRYWLVYLFLVFCSISDTGFQNLQNQYEAKPDNVDPSFDHLIHWINLNTDRNAVFAGPENIVTTVMLTTRRPIVNHPRNEYHNIRQRNQLVYSILSKQHSNDILEQLSMLNIQYIILSYTDCISSSRACKISDIWDYLQPLHRDNIQLCAELFQKINPNFLKVFINEQYLVLKLSQNVQLEVKLSGSSLTELNM